MTKKLEFWGTFGTSLYLIIIALTVMFKFQDFQGLKLNELGDFLAGVFGPIAFLWLVLGFLQQGRELKLSTDALQLQAQELKNSVEQQSIMASAATLQIESQKAALALQQREIERSISPVFVAVSGSRRGGGIGAGGSVHTNVQFQNLGSEAREVSVSFEPPIGDVSLRSLGKLTKGALSLSIDFNFPSSDLDMFGVCEINYLRSDGKRVAEDFTYIIPAQNPFVNIEKRVIEEG
ncbi:hypothetical protein [Pseudomonas protegens]